MIVSVVNFAGETVGEIELLDTVFNQPVNEGLLHQMVVAHLANQRRGTSDTLTRAQVAGGGKKPWRQKGTGRARQGSIRSPLWRKGGVTFGPHPRSYRQVVQKKARRAALRSALSAKLRDGELVVLERVELEAARTKFMREALERLGAPRGLLVVGERAPQVQRAIRNLPGADVRVARDLGVYEVIAHPRVVLTRDAVAAIEEVLG